MYFFGWKNEEERKRINTVWFLPLMNLLGSEKFQELMFDHGVDFVHTNITLNREQGKEDGSAC